MARSCAQVSGVTDGSRRPHIHGVYCRKGKNVVKKLERVGFRSVSVVLDLDVVIKV